jgi:hypothetical protein
LKNLSLRVRRKSQSPRKRQKRQLLWKKRSPKNKRNSQTWDLTIFWVWTLNQQWLNKTNLICWQDLTLVVCLHSPNNNKKTLVLESKIWHKDLDLRSLKLKMTKLKATGQVWICLEILVHLPHLTLLNLL